MEGEPTPGDKQEAVPPEPPSDTGVSEVTKSPEGRPDIKITFLYVLHSPEYVDEIWEKAKDADVILIEKVGQTEQERQMDTHLINRFSSLAQENRNDPTLRLYIEQLRDSNLFSKHFFAKMLEEGGGKEIGYIDVSKEEPLYSEIVELTRLENQIDKLIFFGRIREACKSLIPPFINDSAASDAKREELVLKQVKERYGGAYRKRRIVVIQGAAHTPTYHAAKQEGIPAQRTFIPAPYDFSPMSALIRRQRFFPKKGISDEEYLRATVADYLLIPGAKEVWPNTLPSQQIDFARTLLNRLSAEEINAALDRFAEMRKGKGATTGPISLEKLPEVQEELKREFHADCGAIVKDLAKRHGVRIKEIQEMNSKNS